jgi:hypothetical protein
LVKLPLGLYHHRNVLNVTVRYQSTKFPDNCSALQFLHSLFSQEFYTLKLYLYCPKLRKCTTVQDLHQQIIRHYNFDSDEYIEAVSSVGPFWERYFIPCCSILVFTINGCFSPTLHTPMSVELHFLHDFLMFTEVHQCQYFLSNMIRLKSNHHQDYYTSLYTSLSKYLHGGAETYVQGSVISLVIIIF